MDESLHELELVRRHRIRKYMGHAFGQLLHLIERLGHNEFLVVGVDLLTRRRRRPSTGHGRTPGLDLVHRLGAHFRRTDQFIANTQYFQERAFRVFLCTLLGPFLLLHVVFVDECEFVCTGIRLAFTIEEPTIVAIDVFIIDVVDRIDVTNVAKGRPYNVFLQQLRT